MVCSHMTGDTCTVCRDLAEAMELLKRHEAYLLMNEGDIARLADDTTLFILRVTPIRVTR